MTNNFTPKSIKRRGSSGGTCTFGTKVFCLLGPITFYINIISPTIFSPILILMLSVTSTVFLLSYVTFEIQQIEKPHLLYVYVYKDPNSELAFGCPLCSVQLTKIFLPWIFHLDVYNIFLITKLHVNMLMWPLLVNIKLMSYTKHNFNFSFIM